MRPNTCRDGRLALAVVAVLLATIPAANAQHPAINLLDANGDIIDPVNGDNAGAPFSTRQTCGLCHDYDKITQGYHFQMGWDVVSDDFGAAEGRPWSLSNGFMGRWYPYAFRQLARKVNRTADEIDLTVYDFVGFSSPGRGEPPCGACHPGGGGLEFDRDGNRYDEHLAANPGLADSFDGDYYRSDWVASGVVEADCMICHLKGYDFDARVDQLREGNYRWAVVAGSRIGLVDGSVRRGHPVTVRYETRLFNVDGTITPDVSWPPPDNNCVYCHGTSDVKKRGFSWNDVFNPAIHNQQGIVCAACHPANMDHQIAKGHSRAFTAAPDHDGTMKGCAGCHEEGFMGAPIPDHAAIRPSHLARIACESCHIPELHRAAARGHDATTGELHFFTRPAGDGKPGDVGSWSPDYERSPDGLISPVNAFLAIWWGNRDSDGLVYPLFLREHEAGWRLFSQQVTDDDGDGYREVNRDQEIVAGLEAFSRSLADDARFEQIRPVFIKAETAYELDADGNLTGTPLAGTPLEGATEVHFSINHNVAAPRMALGVKGCADCHVRAAHFFQGRRTTDLFGPDGTAITEANGVAFGCRPIAFVINSIHQQIISPYIGPLIILVVFLIVLHYHSYGPKRITFDPYSDEVQRFSLIERAVHLFRLIAFVSLAVSGLILAFNLHLWQQLLFGSAQRLHDVHVWSGIIFIVTTLAGIVLWFRDVAFTSYDVEWMRKAGGYLGATGTVPAGRFNAGQKMFYWYTAAFGIVMSVTGILLIYKNAFGLATVCITSTFHNLVGFFLIAGVLAHAYLGTVANPGTWRVLVDGSVTREWARHHHPNWYHKLLAEGRIEPDDHDRPQAPAPAEEEEEEEEEGTND